MNRTTKRLEIKIRLTENFSFASSRYEETACKAKKLSRVLSPYDDDTTRRLDNPYTYRYGTGKVLTLAIRDMPSIRVKRLKNALDRNRKLLGIHSFTVTRKICICTIKTSRNKL